uniref:Uncharacterized protein n=1 Tax=Guillardia theta TaxID=55529 RepID=A0A7S4NEE7_GUITH|mmetsp:Transcript_21039/g.70128  ORF Transcript_21039/g.70128 Transcript_21039/m.70128 type:complete len:806 (+) Transcript_21039:17-2434(+)
MKRRREEEGEEEEEQEEVVEVEGEDEMQDSFIDPQEEEDDLAHQHHLLSAVVPGGDGRGDGSEQDELDDNEAGSSDLLHDVQHEHELHDGWEDAEHVDLEKELNDGSDEEIEDVRQGKQVGGDQEPADECEDPGHAAVYEAQSPTTQHHVSFDVDDSVVSNACSSSHVRMLEESIVVEVGNRNRYKLQLEAEMEKNAKASARIASLQTENEHLNVRCSEYQRSSSSKDLLLKSLEAEISELRRQLLDKSSEAEAQHKEHISKMQSELFDKSKEVMTLQKELELSRMSESDLKQTVTRLEERISNLTQSLQQPAEHGLVAPESEESLRSQVKEGEILAKHLRLQVSQLKADAAKAVEFQKELISLRSIKFEAEEANSRCALLEAKLKDSTANESQLMVEKERLQDWEVSLKLCMPDCRSPSDVVNCFRNLQQRNLLLEADVASLREKCSSLEGSAKTLRDNNVQLQGEVQTLKGRAEQLETELHMAKAAREREVYLASMDREMLASFKAEEVLLRDQKVLEQQKTIEKLQADIKAHKEQLRSNASQHSARTSKLEAEIGSLKDELNNNSGELKRCRNEMERYKSNLEKYQTSLEKSEALLESSKAELEQLKKESAGVKEELRVEKEKVAKSAALQGKVDELEGKHKEAEEKLKASLQKSTTDIDNLKKNFAKLRAKFEQAQEVVRLVPLLFGYVITVTQGKKVEGKDYQAIIKAIPKFAEQDKSESFVLRASMPADSSKDPTLFLQNACESENVKKHKEKFLSEPSSPLKEAGVSAFLSAILVDRFENLQKEHASKPKAGEAAGQS